MAVALFKRVNKRLVQSPLYSVRKLVHSCLQYELTKFRNAQRNLTKCPTMERWNRYVYIDKAVLNVLVNNF